MNMGAIMNNFVPIVITYQSGLLNGLDFTNYSKYRP